MKKIYLICNAHLDPVWLWRWHEGAAEAISTFRVAADFCEEFPGFVFNHNEAVLYQWVEEYEPALFSRIQRLVAEGKWHIMGGWYIQPDCTMPSGESFIRQIETGRQYFLEKFGKAPTTAINFDPFGHTRGLVQILAKTGFDSYLFMRPDMEFGDFIWNGFDGSKVVCHKNYACYNSLKGDAVKKITEYMQKYPDYDNSMILWGIGNHGGGPSREDLVAIRKLQGESEYEIFHATPEEYFKTVDKTSLKEKSSSLVHCMVGCYTSMVRIKQKHRALENLLYRCEKMLAHSGVSYDKNELKKAEKSLLFCEFHDILPGSMVKPAEEDGLRMMDAAADTLDALTTRAFFALCSGQKKAKEGEIPVLVYNPHPYPLETELDVEFQLSDQNWNENETTIAKIYDQNGHFLPVQNEKEASSINLDWRKHIVFRANLTPMSINRFDCRLEVVTGSNPIATPSVSDTHIEVKTDLLSCKISKSTGLIDEYKVNGADYLQEGSGKINVFADNEDPWGMTVDSFETHCGSFSLLPDDEANRLLGYPSETTPNVRVIENGDVRMVVQAFFRYGSSTAIVEYTIPRHDIYLDVHLTMLTNDVNKMFKYSLITDVDGGEFTGQTAFGTETLLKEHKEVTFQKWCGLRNNEKGLCIINDGIYAGDAQDNLLNLSLLRTPLYSAHPIEQRKIAPSNRYLDHIDLGERHFRFRLQPDSKTIDAVAAVYNEKPFVLSFFPSGLGDAVPGLLNIDNESVLLSALKNIQDGGLLIRLYNACAHENKTKISLRQVHADVNFGPYEVKTLICSDNAFTETDMLGNIELRGNLS